MSAAADRVDTHGRRRRRVPAAAAPGMAKRHRVESKEMLTPDGDAVRRQMRPLCKGKGIFGSKEPRGPPPPSPRSRSRAQHKRLMEKLAYEDLLQHTKDREHHNVRHSIPDEECVYCDIEWPRGCRDVFVERKPVSVETTSMFEVYRYRDAATLRRTSRLEVTNRHWPDPLLLSSLYPGEPLRRIDGSSLVDWVHIEFGLSGIRGPDVACIWSSLVKYWRAQMHPARDGWVSVLSTTRHGRRYVRYEHEIPFQDVQRALWLFLWVVCDPVVRYPASVWDSLACVCVELQFAVGSADEMPGNRHARLSDWCDYLGPTSRVEELKALAHWVLHRTDWTIMNVPCDFLRHCAETLCVHQWYPLGLQTPGCIRDQRKWVDLDWKWFEEAVLGPALLPPPTLPVDPPEEVTEPDMCDAVELIKIYTHQNGPCETLRRMHERVVSRWQTVQDAYRRTGHGTRYAAKHPSWAAGGQSLPDHLMRFAGLFGLTKYKVA